jgi:hypothetical protein
LRGILFVFLCGLTGCSTVQTLRFPQFKAPVFSRSEEQGKYQDFQGVIHVHSHYSHDSKGKISEIVRAAKRARLDFVILTEHNNLGAQTDGKDGFYDPVLLLAGEEISTRAGHLLALNIRREISPSLDLSQIFEMIEAEKGLSFVAHPTSPRRPWIDWEIRNLTGLEVYNLASDIYQENRLTLGFRFLFYWPSLFFRSCLDRPVEALRVWDRLLQERKTVAIGAVDAHQKVRVLGLTLDEYDSTFRLVQTHVFAKKLSRREIYKALEAGHAYVGFNLTAPVRNFYFTAHSKGVIQPMGGGIQNSDELVFHVVLPGKGRIELIKDGVTVARVKVDQKKGARRKIPASGKGVYRVEVTKGRRPWIISNPIYVT